MGGFPKIEVVYSTSHWLFPKIIIGILIILAAILLIQTIWNRKKEGKPIFCKKGFFVENYDKIKFYGTIILLILYVICLDLFGFLFTSMVFMLLFNLLYSASKERKSILTSVVISVVSSVLIWYVFGVLFNLSLPTGMIGI